MRQEEPILSVRDLRVTFGGPDGVAAAVDGVSFDLLSGETLALVGESGCGKSVTSLSILRLIQSPPGSIEKGTIQFHQDNLLDLDIADLYRIRGDQISMIFQEPMTSLNPVLTIGKQLTEALIFHHNLSVNEARDQILEMLERVQFPEPNTRLKQYPHELSGGMRQRIMIAMALSCNPQILIADEPTTALDVTIQAQILDLMVDLQAEFDTGIILITHDLAVVAELADRVGVMYSGKIVEDAPVKSLFDNPLHPYSRGLMNSLPRLDLLDGDSKQSRLTEMPGVVPSIFSRPKGCYFAPRCSLATERCRNEAPPFEKKFSNHFAACWEIESS